MGRYFGSYQRALHVRTFGVINFALNENQGLSTETHFRLCAPGRHRSGCADHFGNTVDSPWPERFAESAPGDQPASPQSTSTPYGRVGFTPHLAVLLEDIPSITSLLSAIPLLCINFAVVIACLVYMSWLSPKLFAIML